MAQKKIKNVSLQSFEIVTKLPNGQFDHVWLEPNGSIVVSDEAITDLVRVAAERKLIKIS